MLLLAQLDTPTNTLDRRMFVFMCRQSSCQQKSANNYDNANENTAREIVKKKAFKVFRMQIPFNPDATRQSLSTDCQSLSIASGCDGGIPIEIVYEDELAIESTSLQSEPQYTIEQEEQEH